ncbi:hypothetical protein FRC12_008067 [Ceratobasidium sp. 428]|nr:hypothetical protein FRC12_008067 [Ceratobasidium sp. 428]
MLSRKYVQGAAVATWSQHVSDSAGHEPLHESSRGSKSLQAQSLQASPGSLVLEKISYSDIETDVEELADHFSSITDLDDDVAERIIAAEDYFETHEELTITPEDVSPKPDVTPKIEHIKLPSDVHLVAYSSTHQRYFEDYGIAWGVQWEIARLTTAYPDFSWEHVDEEDLLRLCGPNAICASSVSKILLAKSPKFAEYARRERLIALPALVTPWDGYDKEEAYIRSGRDSGLVNDHGGNVTQRIHLQVITESSPAQATINDFPFKFTLEQPQKSKACRFSRYLGSRRLIQCHFSEKDGRTHRAAIIKFFASKKLLINGRLFQAFYGHGSKVELMEINEDVGRTPDPIVGDHNRMSLLDFITWHNNFELNYRQIVGKWVSRFSLGFSASLVGLTFAHNNIHFIDDIYAPGTTRGDAEAHEIMTDGCGLLNWAALRAVQEKMNWEVFPVHVQARIAGAKGLFMLHPEHRDADEQPQIWIRSSQSKVKLQAKDAWSPFHYALDVCSGPFLQQPSSITYEMILCLSAGGVPDQLLIDLLRKSIETIASEHEPSSHAHGSQILWDSIYNAHRVLQNRLRQAVSPEEQRSNGFVSYNEDGEIIPEEAATARWDVWPDLNSGAPASAQEQVLGWLQSGFSPTDPWVMEKLIYLQSKLITAAINKYRITIPQSLRAHIIPDPIGVLAEGEIFFASGQASLEDSSGFKTHCITGPVIVSRNPCVQKSDARKVTAVENYKLWSLGYHGAVVFSTQGNFHLASLLSGGDYDGDSVVLIWDEDIVDKFVNSDLDTARPSVGFEAANFTKSKHMLGDLVSRSRLQNRKLETELITALLQDAVKDKPHGLYNMFYRNSVYLNGLNHPDTIRLGHMFTQCLDSTKSGLMVKQEVLRQDKKKWYTKIPECFVLNKERPDDESRGSKKTVNRNPNLPPFILDSLRRIADEEAKAYNDRLCIRRDELVKSNTTDEDLIKPFEDAQNRVSQYGFEDDLTQIKSHVEKYRGSFWEARQNKGEFSPFKRHGKSVEGKGKGKSKDKDLKGGNNMSPGEMQEDTRAVSEAYNRNLPSGLLLFDEAAIRRVAASYAYHLDKSGRDRKSKYDFSFGVAWAELCLIKARATGGDFVALASGYVDSMTMHKKITRMYREAEMDTESG